MSISHSSPVTVLLNQEPLSGQYHSTPFHFNASHRKEVSLLLWQHDWSNGCPCVSFVRIVSWKSIDRAIAVWWLGSTLLWNCLVIWYCWKKTHIFIVWQRKQLKVYVFLRNVEILSSWHQTYSSFWIHRCYHRYRLFFYFFIYWCAILIAHQIVMAKHGGSCVHFSGISTCGRTSRETVSHPQRQPLPTPYKIFLYPSTLLWQIHGCNL